MRYVDPLTDFGFKKIFTESLAFFAKHSAKHP